jgi:Na+-transporting NADH:ubiquinone oxidoreductase subunit A
MEELGIYEIIPEDFALCEVICTSKQPLQEMVRKGLDILYNEMN